MNKIPQHQEIDAVDIAESVAEDLRAYLAREWPESVITEMPAQYLVRLMDEITALEQRLSTAKRLAAEKAMAHYGVSARTITAHASVSPQTAAKWKKEPLQVDVS
jgi:hypothetical protein